MRPFFPLISQLFRIQQINIMQHNIQYYKYYLLSYYSQQIMQNSYLITTIAKEQIYMYPEVIISLGWDPVINQCLLLWEAFSQGWFVGRLNNQIISMMLVLKYSKKYGFVGFYWVSEKYRNKGYGLPIFKKGMEYLQQCQIIRLTTSKGLMIQNYKKWGFEEQDYDVCISCKKIPKIDSFTTSIIINDLQYIGLQKVSNYDQKYFPSKRDNYLKKMFEIGNPFFSIDKITKEVLGYACVTPTGTGYVISPLVAQNDDIAQDLMKFIFMVYRQEKYEIGTKNKLNVFVQGKHQKIMKFMQKWFPQYQYRCLRMAYRTKHFVKDLDTSHNYAFGGFYRE